MHVARRVGGLENKMFLSLSQANVARRVGGLERDTDPDRAGLTQLPAA